MEIIEISDKLPEIPNSVIKLRLDRKKTETQLLNDLIGSIINKNLTKKIKRKLIIKL